MRYEDVPKTYAQLLAMHPLRPIHNDVELDHATEMIDLLAGHELNADQADYLDVLSTLVEAYENTHYPLNDPTICGLDALRAWLDDHDTSATDLARLLGIHRSMGSKLLKGECTLSACCHKGCYWLPPLLEWHVGTLPKRPLCLSRHSVRIVDF